MVLIKKLYSYIYYAKVRGSSPLGSRTVFEKTGLWGWRCGAGCRISQQGPLEERCVGSCVVSLCTSLTSRMPLRTSNFSIRVRFVKHTGDKIASWRSFGTVCPDALHVAAADGPKSAKTYRDPEFLVNLAIETPAATAPILVNTLSVKTMYGGPNGHTGDANTTSLIIQHDRTDERGRQARRSRSSRVLLSRFSRAPRA